MPSHERDVHDPNAPRDLLEVVIRFVFGAAVGVAVAFLWFFRAGGVGVLIGGVTIVAFGVLAVRFGDSFWHRLSGWLRWW